MVSEGVDIPRLRVGVYATNTVTELFFRQAVGRLVRWTGGLAARPPTCSSPTTSGCARSRRPSPSSAATACGAWNATTRATSGGGSWGPRTSPAIRQRPSRRGGRAALALHRAVRRPARRSGPPPRDGPDLRRPDPRLRRRRRRPRRSRDIVGRRRAPPVPLPEPELAATPAGPGASQRQSALARRRQLRDANAAAVADLVHLTGRSHAELNAELNRRVGIRRITEASVRQLELRHQAAVKMMTARRPS